jgi:hypothetical protein
MQGAARRDRSPRHDQGVRGGADEVLLDPSVAALDQVDRAADVVFGFRRSEAPVMCPLHRNSGGLNGMNRSN